MYTIVYNTGLQIAITVFGVITEPGEHTTNISLYGIEFGGRSWVVVTLNFDPIFSRDCGDDDYYDWLPWDDVRLINTWIYQWLYIAHFATLCLHTAFRHRLHPGQLDRD